MVAGNPHEIIELKTFHAMVFNEHEALKKEKENYIIMPAIRKIDAKEIYATCQIIKQDVLDIMEPVMEEILNDPGREHLMVRKG